VDAVVSLRNDVIKAAEEVADNAIASVIDAIVAAGYERRQNAAWYYVFHREMLAALPKWRWLARYHHARMLARARSQMRANKAFRNLCPMALVREAEAA
jgi:hypothetical protein